MKSLVLVCVTAVAILVCNAEELARPEKWAVPMTCAGVPNLHKVSDKLYRSAQPTAEGMTNLVALGIKTVVNLRDNHSDSDEIGGLPLKARRIEIFTANLRKLRPCGRVVIVVNQCRFTEIIVEIVLVDKVADCDPLD